MTPLMWAVWKISSLDPTRLLITLGASPNLSDHQGNTALHWAILARNTTAISTLILQVMVVHITSVPKHLKKIKNLILE